MELNYTYQEYIALGHTDAQWETYIKAYQEAEVIEINILAMEAGFELDRKILAEIFEVPPEIMSDTPSLYSTDISDAWLVVDKIHACLFSRRQDFLHWLQILTIHQVKGTGDVTTIAWPDVFFHITPETICKAALLSQRKRCE